VNASFHGQSEKISCNLPRVHARAERIPSPAVWKPPPASKYSGLALDGGHVGNARNVNGCDVGRALSAFA
jgi:hypothetical protein